jgi:hypothetical protein
MTSRADAISFAALALALGSPAGPAQALSGRWRLNESESEDARAKLAEARARSGGGAGRPQGRPHGGGYGGHRGGGSRGAEHGEPGRLPAAMQELMHPSESLVITGNDAELTFDDRQGRLMRMAVDGKVHRDEAEGVERTARWKGASLEVESRSSGGASLTASYTPLEPRKLEVVLRLSGRQGDPVSVRRVYDPAPDE